MTVTDLQHTEGWNIGFLFRLLDPFTLSAEPTKGPAPLSVAITGDARFNDGGEPETIDVASISPEGNTSIETLSVTDGSFSTSVPLETTGEWTVEARSEHAGFTHIEGWEN